MTSSATIVQAGVPPASQLTSMNRSNIPAICRIPGCGTAFLISPGLLLTSTRVIGSRQEAARHRAVFFETGKREPVEVKLLPDQFYFAAGYPEYLDYCVVACETSKIYNVTPVKLPLVQTEWPTVREGDHLLVVQHPVYSHRANPHSSVSPAAAEVVAADSAEQTVELKRFDEVLRRRDDVLYLKPNGTHTTAGCPAFNDNSTLIGLQTQFDDSASGTEAMESRIVSIVTIVKHLFANGRLNIILQEPLFDDVWKTWCVTGDTSRMVSVLQNFRQKELSKKAALHLFEHAAKRENTDSVVGCGGTKVMIDAITRHQDDENFVAAGLRALWNISFTAEDNRLQIRDANGVAVILSSLRLFPLNEEVAQFSVVLLYNLTLTRSTVTNDWAPGAMKLIFSAMRQFALVEVIQKFAIGFHHNLVSAEISYAMPLIDDGILEFTAEVMSKFPANEYLIENAVKLVSTIASAPRYQGLPQLACCVSPVIAAVTRFSNSNTVRVEGNHALWGLGCDPRNRIAIFSDPNGASALQSSIFVVSADRQL
jgi:hypothetical protein